jgi:hypothetical protein
VGGLPPEVRLHPAAPWLLNPESTARDGEVLLLAIHRRPGVASSHGRREQGMRNGAARLWWAAKLTFDPNRENPYELTGVLLRSLDVAKNLLERNFGRAPSITRAFLEFVLQNLETCLASGNKSRYVVRQLSKALNLHGGVCVLDCMKEEEVLDFLRLETTKSLERFATDSSDDSDEEEDEE